MVKVTIDDILALGPCGTYDRDRLKKLFGRKRKASLADVCKAKVSSGDRLWLAIYGPWIDDRQRRLFAADCAERVLPIFERENPGDQRLREAIAVARRFATGGATLEELAAAGAAAWDSTWAAAGQWQLKRIQEYADGQHEG